MFEKMKNFPFKALFRDFIEDDSEVASSMLNSLAVSTPRSVESAPAAVRRNISGSHLDTLKLEDTMGSVSSTSSEVKGKVKF